MANFNITSPVTVAQTLTSGEAGMVTQTGSISVNNTAVTMNANADLIVNGSVIGFGTVINAPTATDFELVIGQTGNVLSGSVAISADPSTGSFLLNHGAISATGTAVILTADGGATLSVTHDVINTGTISSTADAIILESAGNAVTELINSGTISGTGDGIDNAQTLDGITVLRNSGALIGGQPFNPSDYAYRGGAGSDNIFNTGLIDGNVDLGAGSDLFDGRGGTVTGSVAGGDGNDVYRIDDSSVEIVETALGGTDDRVEAHTDYTLPENVESLLLLGTGSWDGVGNALDNGIGGNDGDNTLTGLGGRDLIFGEAGDDLILGGIGDDTLVGDQGRDTIFGGSGDDSLFGEADDDLLSGNIGNDVLDGGDGDDLLRGGAGDDRLIGRDDTDTLSGGIGGDTLLGGRGDDLLLGGLGDDDLVGGTDSDTLVGGDGADTLAGGSGADVFLFKIQIEPIVADTDIITDFAINEDVMDMRHLYDGTLEVNINAGFSGGGVASLRTAEIAGDTRVFVDLDGDGVQDLRIFVTGALGLTEGDFIV